MAYIKKNNAQQTARHNNETDPRNRDNIGNKRNQGRLVKKQQRQRHKAYTNDPLHFDHLLEFRT